MEQKKFRLRLNLFDGIVLLLALAAAGVLLWMTMRPAAPADGAAAPTVKPIRYTIQISRCVQGTGAMVHEGDILQDNSKNQELGRVVSFEVKPASALVLDQTEKAYELETIPNREDITFTLESECTTGDTDLTLTSGYAPRVGATVYVRGVGYVGVGTVISIEREGLE